jgi:cystathionine beta-lyase/cystathionine gamma-synthase
MQAILALNDIRTVRSKMDLMSQNTLRVAEWLSAHPAVEKVEYLGLPDHPLHELGQPLHVAG